MRLYGRSRLSVVKSNVRLHGRSGDGVVTYKDLVLGSALSALTGPINLSATSLMFYE